MVFLQRSCEILLLALLFSLPYEYFFIDPDQTLYSSLKLQSALLSGCWLLWKAFCYLHQPCRGDRRSPSRPGRAPLAPTMYVLPGRLALAAVVLVAVQGVAALAAPEFSRNAARAAIKAAAAFFLMWVSADIALGAESRLENRGLWKPRVLVVLTFTGTIVAVLGLGEIAGWTWCKPIIDLFQTHRYFVASRMRFSSTMEYPNTAGSFIAACLFANIALAWAMEGRTIRVLARSAWTAAASVQCLAILFTYSKGAVFSTVVALGVVSLTFLKPALGRAWKIGLLLLLLVLAAAQGLVLLLPEPPQSSLVPLHKRRSARFGLAAGEEVKFLTPAREYEEMVRVRNDSEMIWVREGFGLAYRWHDFRTGQMSPLTESVTFPRDIARNQEEVLQARFRTPPESGEYMLIWFVFHRFPLLQQLERSYSPGIVCVVGDGKPVAEAALSDSTRRGLKAIRLEREQLASSQIPSRWDLWHAAWRMWRTRPLVGVGPDNFRLLKWQYMDIPRGDETILANSLYLEFLAGSGLLGLSALLWLLWEISRRLLERFRAATGSSDRAVAAFALVFMIAFLTHGLVDYFLKFTPTFLLFWILIGVLCAKSPAGGEVHAHRI